MIYTGQTYEEGNKPSRNYDEMWCIMRYPTKGLKCNTIHHPELAPSEELYATYQNLKKEGKWNWDSFKQIYVPQFIKEVANNPAARDSLNYLYRNRKEKNIILLCACKDDKLCHRSIIRGLLVGAVCACIETLDTTEKSIEEICTDYFETDPSYFTAFRQARKEALRHSRGEL